MVRSSAGVESLRIAYGVKIVLLVCLVAVLVVPVAFYVGKQVGLNSCRDQLSQVRVKQLKRLIELEPERFNHLTAVPDARGRALILGTVHTQGDFDLLQEKVLRTFGYLEGPNYIILVRLRDANGAETEPMRFLSTAEELNIGGLGFEKQWAELAAMVGPEKGSGFNSGAEKRIDNGAPTPTVGLSTNPQGSAAGEI
jgi:hypothetical protein